MHTFAKLCDLLYVLLPVAKPESGSSILDGDSYEAIPLALSVSNDNLRCRACNIVHGQQNASQHAINVTCMNNSFWLRTLQQEIEEQQKENAIQYNMQHAGEQNHDVINGVSAYYAAKRQRVYLTKTHLTAHEEYSHLVQSLAENTVSVTNTQL